ncbi:putative ABC transport system permease protein [Glaciihabitans tibetensis]|uniref:Putative ABC transport system permease protein n=1 Tax=Glaciihabitans tibetensis TaxID=1266600 RepID=A0A2T0VJ33_9MICO|nr:ABC transporter permease [Glaciihabitans tibetensis]PRY70231.1 putative ABC transport system permease protein [Glaciihabitans tibetensis]
MWVDRVRDHGSSVLVAGLSSAFGVTLLQVSDAIAAIVAVDDTTGSSGSAAVMLQLASAVFIVIAVYVGAVVTTNTFATIIAGRTGTIALMRLLGSTASAQRAAVSREGLWVGVIGGGLGLLAGTAVTWIALSAVEAIGAITVPAFALVSPVLAAPIVAVIVTTWLASWVGSRPVLGVSPMQATGAAQDKSYEETVSRRSRNVVAVIAFVLGIGLLVGGVVVGLVTPAGVLIGVAGGALSFAGLAFGAHLVIPRALRVVGRLFGGGATARLAAENAVRYPERTSRNMIGVVIGVTLVTMFTVALSSFAALMERVTDADPAAYSGADDVLLAITAVFAALTGFSALIAAVGLVNNLSLSVLQRTRELGLLRALGLTAGQVRRMVVLESAQLTVTAVLLGLALGTFYGWAGAQSMFGSLDGGQFVTPVLPLGLVVALAVCAAGLTAISSVVAAGKATRVTPVAALAAI